MRCSIRFLIFRGDRVLDGAHQLTVFLIECWTVVSVPQIL